jgi:hypothetical protein
VRFVDKRRIGVSCLENGLNFGGLKSEQKTHFAFDVRKLLENVGFSFGSKRGRNKIL